jgi:hypothetical protein
MMPWLEEKKRRMKVGNSGLEIVEDFILPDFYSEYFRFTVAIGIYKYYYGFLFERTSKELIMRIPEYGGHVGELAKHGRQHNWLKKHGSKIKGIKERYESEWVISSPEAYNKLYSLLIAKGQVVSNCLSDFWW